MSLTNNLLLLCQAIEIGESDNKKKFINYIQTQIIPYYNIITKNKYVPDSFALKVGSFLLEKRNYTPTFEDVKHTINYINKSEYKQLKSYIKAKVIPHFGTMMNGKKSVKNFHIKIGTFLMSKGIMNPSLADIVKVANFIKHSEK